MIDKRVIGKESNTIKKLKKIKRCLDIILCIIIVPILIVNLVMIVKRLINPKKTADFLGYKFFVIFTGSMEETLQIGDFIIIKEVPEQKLKEQDIITFNSENTVITHRIVKTEYKDGQTYYTTKGDNNNSEDTNKLTISDIEGRFVCKIAFLGKILMFFQKPIGLTILIITPILIGLISFKISSYINQKKMIRKTKRLKYDEEKNEEKY
ncbi:MAG: signal peptidase I [Clostridia bacterium]|nr:signal peptidase I [Clostridia bacterium]